MLGEEQTIFNAVGNQLFEDPENLTVVISNNVTKEEVIIAEPNVEKIVEV